MNNRGRYDRFEQLAIRWVLVVLPTILIGYITLVFLNRSYTFFNTSVWSQTLYFGLAVLFAYSLYYYGARWVITLLLLLVLNWMIGKIINRLPGEFDVFYASARYQLYSTVFIAGWLFGFLLSRIRWTYIIVFGLLAVVTLVSISDTIDISLSYVLAHILPVLLYGLYMFFLSPRLAAPLKLDGRKSIFFALRIVLVLALILLAFILTERLFRSDLKAVEKELAARGAKGKDDAKGDKGGYDDRNGLMEKGGNDDGYRLKDTMRVNSKMSQSDKLMFCSKLDNFFPDGSPAPLYFVYHYLTRFDSASQSFTRDINIPSFDEFDVDPANLPMYYSRTDTSILRKSMGMKFRKVVEAQVYLSENTWKHAVLAPASVFSIQTIPVEKEFQKTFLSAYKIASFVSDLNNAYFVYNVSASPMLSQLQEKRHEELRTIRNYNGVNREFMSYYTRNPSGGIYDSITKLALDLVPKDLRPVDKVIAVRDFFLKRNEYGERIFRYSLQAGAVDDPNIPSAKMLYNFLYKTHTGYCTYYAGASLFMLRALGIPTRFTTGFATINRSDKNKGWYWFYASQAHAWTQVYFPEYGWMDFDMTIGNEDQQSAPKPDGTPPLPPPDPWLVLNARADAVDLKGKKVTATFSQMIFLNTTYLMNRSFTRPVDATVCRVLFNKRDTTFAAIHPGDSVLIISYKDDEKKIPQPRPGVAIEDQVEGFPSPIIADEIHIRGKEPEKKKDDDGKKGLKEKEKEIDWEKVALTAGKTAVGLVVLFLLFPLLYLIYRMTRVATARRPSDKADQVYRAALYRFHMAGYERENETPLFYARTVVDRELEAKFEEFMGLYLRLKYSNEGSRAGDSDEIKRFASRIGPSIRAKKNIFRLAIQYFNVLLALRYFQSPQKSDYETPSL